MADRNNQNPHPDATPVSSYTSCHSDRSPVGAKRRNLFQYSCCLPNSLCGPVYHSCSCLLSLLPSTLLPFASSWLRGYKSFMQNKPNSQNAKIAATSSAPRTYPNIPLPCIQEKQTQTNPIPPLPTSPILPRFPFVSWSPRTQGIRSPSGRPQGASPRSRLILTRPLTLPACSSSVVCPPSSLVLLPLCSHTFFHLRANLCPGHSCQFVKI